MFFARFGATSDGWGSNDQKTDNRDQGGARRSDRRGRADSGAPAAKADEMAICGPIRRFSSGVSTSWRRPRLRGNPYGIGETGQGPVSVQMTGGSFPRSFLIPGTDTSIRVGGEMRLNALYWIDGGNPNPTSHQTNAGATGQSGAIPLNSDPVARNKGEICSTCRAAVEIERRNPHTDRMGRSAHLPRIRLRQPGAGDEQFDDGQHKPEFAISDNISSVSVRLRHARVLCSSARRTRISAIPTRAWRPSRSPV